MGKGNLERLSWAWRLVVVVVAVSGGLAGSLMASPARAAEQLPPEVSDGSGLGLRGLAGIGFGKGIASGASVQLDYWILPRLAVGVGTGAGQAGTLYSSGDAVYVAGALSVRSDAVGNYWLLGVDAGYATGTYHYEDDNCPLFSLYEDCEFISESRKSVYFGATAGWLAHWTDLELGPVLRLQGGAGYAGLLLNLALGWQ